MSPKYLQLPSEEQRESVRRDVNCTKESLERDVQHLIQWMEKQPHLPTLKDEDVLEHWLINCKNSLEKTKSRIEMYYHTKAIMPELYRNRNPFDEKMKRITELGIYVPLPKVTPDGYRVYVLSISDEIRSVTDFSVIESFLKINQMTFDLVNKYDYVKGVIILHDGKNVTMPLVAALSSYLLKLTLLSQKAAPARYKNLCFFNVGPAAEILLSIAKSVFKKNIASRIKVMKNISDICKFLPKEILPKNYGGDELPIEELSKLWFEELKNNHEYFKTTESMFMDLSKVPKDYKTTDLTGLTGSFRQLSFD